MNNAIQDARQIDLAEAQRFLKLLDPETDEFTFQTFDDSDEKRQYLARIFHGTLEQHAHSLSRLNEQGAGVFVTINKTDLRGRKTENVIKVRKFFLDSDGAPIKPIKLAAQAGKIMPCCFVESSPGNAHVYFNADCELDEFGSIQSALANKFGTDPSVHDCPRVMRIPGFYHLKRKNGAYVNAGGPFQVRILKIWGNAPAYTPAQMIQGLVLDDGKHDALAADIPSNIQSGFQMPPDGSIGDGGRNNFLTKAAGWMQSQGTNGKALAEMLHMVNVAKCSPPLDADEVENIAASVRRYDTPAAATIPASPDGWPAPAEIKATLPPLPPFDSLLLPPVFRAWVNDIADRMQCPVEFLAVGALVAAGSVVGNRIGVQPKRLDTGWVEVPNLWGAVVGRPGVMKSPALAEVIAPLKKLEVAARSSFSVTRAQFEIEKMMFEAAKKTIEACIKKGAAVNASQLPVEPEEPQPARHLVNDSTYQKLGEVLSGNPHGLMVFQDELSGLLMRLDADGQESARAFYLQAWDGKQSYTFDRIGRGTVGIHRLCFSVMGGLQPSKLREYLRSAVYGGKGDDGLAQRLQMLVYPDISPEWRRVDRRPDMSAATAAGAVFGLLAALDPVAIGARVQFDGDIPVLGFDDEAQALFNQWWAELETSLRTGEHHPAIESHISKYRKLVPALALLDHLILGQHGDITAESLLRAIHWQRFLFAHAQRSYAAVTSATMDSAKSLSEKIIQGKLNDGFTVRDVYRPKWSLLSTVKEATEAVDVLVDLGWLRAARDERINNTDGRPTVRYFINPRLNEVA